MRLCHIMNDLLEAKDYLSLDHFIKTYEVSKRTIQNDLSYLMQMSSTSMLYGPVTIRMLLFGMSYAMNMEFMSFVKRILNRTEWDTVKRH